MLLHYIKQYRACQREALQFAEQASRVKNSQEYELLRMKAFKCLEKAKEYNALIRLC
jgi:hypothetical protein